MLIILLQPTTRGQRGRGAGGQQGWSTGELFPIVGENVHSFIYLCIFILSYLLIYDLIPIGDRTKPKTMNDLPLRGERKGGSTGI